MKSLLLTVILVTTSALSVQAATLKWIVQSDYDYAQQLVFYSKTYNRSWPGGGRVYNLTDSDPHTFSLACTPGENICYGAWPDRETDGLQWGVGYKGKLGCSNCCFRCGQGPSVRSRLGN